MPIYRLIDAPLFPRPELADESGLVAFGGDLKPSRLLAAYRQGIFPWGEEEGYILWWNPDPRLILEFADLKVSRSLRKTLRSGRFEITFDQAMEAVLNGCASDRPEGTWLNPDLQQAYRLLFAMGYAHSVEVWKDGLLVGGLYGTAIGTAFFGESMFARVSDASKVALVALVEMLEDEGYTLLDCQVRTDHLISLGARELSRPEFLQRLSACVHSLKPSRPWTRRLSCDGLRRAGG